MNLELGPKQLDILKEVGNVGAGHAATALSVLMNDNVKVSVTAARLCEFDGIADVVGGPEQIVVGVFIRIQGDIEGSVMLLLSDSSAHHLLQRLMNKPAHEEEFTDIELSALAEVGNILAGSYTNAIGRLSGLSLTQSVPAIAVDMAAAILDIGLSFVGEYADSAILIDTKMSQGTAVVDGHVLLLPDPPFARPLLKALGDQDE